MAVAEKNLQTVEFVASKRFVETVKNALTVSKVRRLEVLNHVSLSFKRDWVELSATDLELYYRESVCIEDLDVGHEMTVLVHQDALKTIKKGMTLKFRYNAAEIDGITYPCMVDCEEFPKFPVPDSKFQMVFVNRQYFDDLTLLAQSSSKSELRPVLTGIVHRNNNMTATDGLRLMEVKSETMFENPFILPASSTKLLSKAFDGGAKLITDHSYAFYGASEDGRLVQVTCRLIDGNYPDTSRIIPTGGSISGTVRNIQQWVACVGGCIKALKTDKASQRDNMVVRMELADDTISFNSKAKSGAEFSDYALIQGTCGAELVMSANAEYLKTALEQTGEGSQVWFNSSTQPFMFTSEDGRKRALVSPVFTR